MCGIAAVISKDTNLLNQVALQQMSKGAHLSLPNLIIPAIFSV